MMHDILIPEEEREEQIEINDDVKEGIRNNKLHVAIDTSALHNQMGGHWKIVNFENQIFMSKEIFNTMGNEQSKSCGSFNHTAHAGICKRIYIIKLRRRTNFH